MVATWPQQPSWVPIDNINSGEMYKPADGVTVADMNNILNNIIYLKKYGGRLDVLSIDATVEDGILKLKSEDA